MVFRDKGKELAEATEIVFGAMGFAYMFLSIIIICL